MSDNARMVKRVEQVRDCTVADLFDWLAQRGLDPSLVTISSTHLKWESEETPAERERRETFQRAADARHEKWERETYERLHARYGTGVDSMVDA